MNDEHPPTHPASPEGGGPSPSDETLLDAVLGRLGPDEQRAVNDASRRSPDVAERFGMFKHLVSRAREASDFMADASSISRAQAMFEAMPQQDVLSGERLIAELAVGGGEFVAGLRAGVEASDFVEMTAGGYRVSLRLTPMPNGGVRRAGGPWRLRASVAPPTDHAGGVVEAHSVEPGEGVRRGPVATTSVDDDGHFVLMLPPGVYDLLIEPGLSKCPAITIPGVEVG